MSQFKCNILRAGGVSIYEKEDVNSDLASNEHSLLKYDEKEMKVKRIATVHDGVGDICAIETTINNKRALLVSIYIILIHKKKTFSNFSLRTCLHTVQN